LLRPDYERTVLLQVASFVPVQGHIHGLKSGGRIMASARNKAPRGLGVSRGVSPPDRGGVWGGGYAPSPEIFPIFELKLASFGAFWALILLQ